MPHEIIQFARIVYVPEGAGWRKGHPWTLDIRKNEKERANKETTENRDAYDPTFTNTPRGTNPGGSMVGPAPTGKPAIRQQDAPGMTKERYDELAVTPIPVTVVFQFMAFLVCRPPGDKPTAGDYLDKAKVVRVALFSVQWRFEGIKGGRPATPKLGVSVKQVKDGRCGQNLRALVDANGLMDAYKAPGPAESRDLTEAEHNALIQSAKDAKIRGSQVW